MSTIQNIKNTIGHYILSGEMKMLHRDKKFINMNDAKSVGIIFDATGNDNFELVKKYIGYLKEMKKQVKAIGFYNLKAIPAMSYSKLEYDFFSLKDLNWYNAPANIYVKNFMEEKFDILLDLNLNDLFPLHYASALSKASFKVGKKGNKNSAIFDLTIDTDKRSDLKFFLRNIDTYLFIINKNTENNSNK